MGKTFTLLAGTIAATRFSQLEADEMQREDLRPSRPTLIVVPDGLEYKWLDDAYGSVTGHDWKVCRWRSSTTKANSKDLAGFDSCTMDPHDPAWQCAQSFVIMTCGTKKLAALKTINARFRHCFSATIVHDSVMDMRGILDFFERPEFSDPFDRNRFVEGKPHLGQGGRSHRGPGDPRYEEFLQELPAKYRDPEPTAADLAGGREGVIDMPDLGSTMWQAEAWDEDCDCPEAEQEDEYLCHRHWPASQMQNRIRSNSVDDDVRVGPEGKTRKKFLKDGGDLEDWQPPFRSNPFNLFNWQNANNVRCLTVTAWDWWVATHLWRTRAEPNQGDFTFAAHRLRTIFEILVLARRPRTQIRDMAGDVVHCDKDLPRNSVTTYELRPSFEQQQRYKHSIASLFPNEVDDVKPGDLAVKLKREERIVRVESDAHLAMNTYGGTNASLGRPPVFFRDLRVWSLPEYVNLMKKEGALDPGAREEPFGSPVDVLSQILWCPPKLAQLLLQVRSAILGVACGTPRDKRKMLLYLQLPESGEVILKRVE